MRLVLTAPPLPGRFATWHEAKLWLIPPQVLQHCAPGRNVWPEEGPPPHPPCDGVEASHARWLGGRLWARVGGGLLRTGEDLCLSRVEFKIQMDTKRQGEGGVQD